MQTFFQVAKEHQIAEKKSGGIKIENTVQIAKDGGKKPHPSTHIGPNQKKRELTRVKT
jgi:hypothetical protein